MGGIVVMRYGMNALNVINGVKKKLAEIKPSLPPGVRDRGRLRPFRTDPRIHQDAAARSCLKRPSSSASSSSSFCFTSAPR